MTAYVVFVRDGTHNEVALRQYMAEVAPTFEGHDVKFLAAYGAHEVLEGPPIEGAVILEFPSFEAAKAWYFGADYQAVAQHRFNGSSYRGFIVEGK